MTDSPFFVAGLFSLSQTTGAFPFLYYLKILPVFLGVRNFNLKWVFPIREAMWQILRVGAFVVIQRSVNREKDSAASPTCSMK